MAVPLLLYFGIVFVSTFYLCARLKITFPIAVTQSFTAASNNFELALAVAIATYGATSQVALAATIGPLIEVPALLGLVYASRLFRKYYPVDDDTKKVVEEAHGDVSVSMSHVSLTSRQSNC